MESRQEAQADMTMEPGAGANDSVQAGAWLLELSLDWIVLRASENVHHLLGESHVTVIDEPLGRFVHSQALHDLRNLFSRLSGTTGIGRAYAVRLTDEHEFVDVAFQLANGRVLLEAVPSSGSFGEAFGTVGGLIAGLSDTRGQALLDGAARRMRALTGYDRVTVQCGEHSAQSSRGAFTGSGDDSGDLPDIVANTKAEAVPIFPRGPNGGAMHSALLRAPDAQALEVLEQAGIRSLLRVPFRVGRTDGEFRCDCRIPQPPSFEIHAAVELFAQMFALRLEMEGMRPPAVAGS
jgi:light-regulated signal transduction histidine kinase (bacteriophytochrome)